MSYNDDEVSDEHGLGDDEALDMPEGEDFKFDDEDDDPDSRFT